MAEPDVLMNLQKAEIEALENSARVLKFIAEHRKQAALPVEVVSTITHAWELAESNRWDPDAAKEFWINYSALCDIIQPATLDTIEANSFTITPRRWLCFGRKEDTTNAVEADTHKDSGAGKAKSPEATTIQGADTGSTKAVPATKTAGFRLLFRPTAETGLSRRFAEWCMWALLLLLVLVLIFGYIASSADALSREVRSLMTEGDKSATQVRADIDGVFSELARMMADDKLKSSFDPAKSPLDQDLINIPLPSEATLKVTQLRDHLQSLYYYTDTMFQKVQAISAINPMVRTCDKYAQGDLTPVPVLRHALANLSSYYWNRREINERLQTSWIWIAMYNAFVPMLLGALGACTYVVRLISEEIRETTFSRTSPIRHIMRIALGALAGVIIGLRS